MYRQMELHFPGVREVWQYHDQQCGAPGKKRQKRGKEASDVRNQRQKERKCRWRLRQYYRAGDSYITLTCQKDLRPADMSEMKGRWTAFIRELRKAYRKDNVTFRWIRNIEVGSKGAWHIHAAIPALNRNMAAVIAKAWPWGKAQITAMYDEGKFQELAQYLTKTPRTDKRLSEADHASSRNMPIQAPVEKTMVRWPTFEGQEVKMVPKGWYIDKSSVEEYMTPMGYPVRRFQMFEIEQNVRKGKKRKLVNAGSVRIPEHGVDPPDGAEDPGRGKPENSQNGSGKAGKADKRQRPAVKAEATGCAPATVTAKTASAANNLPGREKLREITMIPAGSKVKRPAAGRVHQEGEDKCRFTYTSRWTGTRRKRASGPTDTS